MRVEPKPIAAYPWFIRIFFWNQRRRYGRVLLPGMVWGRSPWVFASLALLYGALDRKRSPIEPALRSLVTVRISQLNHCAFCVDINSATLLKRGVAMPKVEALRDWPSSTLFSERERAALAYSDAVTRADQPATADAFAAVKAHFDADAIVELTGLIAFQNMSSKFNAALDIPSQEFCLPPAQTAIAPAK